MSRSYWSPEDDKTLRDMVRAFSYAEIGTRLGRSASAVSNRARRLGAYRYAPHDEGKHLRVESGSAKVRPGVIVHRII